MPASSTFTADGRGFERVWTGVVTGDDLLAADADVLRMSDEVLTRVRYAVNDFAQVTELRVTPSEIGRLVQGNERLARLNADLTVAIIAPDGVAFGLSRMWQSLVEKTGWPTAVFRTRRDALIWLRQRFPDLEA